MSKLFSIHHQETLEAHPDTHFPDRHQDHFSKTILGFWTYLMTDTLLFATLFCAYAVLHSETFDGPSSKDLFSLRDAFTETLILLLSSFTVGLGSLSALQNKKKPVIAWFAISFLLGASFVGLELAEFTHLFQEGNSWERSAFLSSFFALVSTHGLHVSVGLLWILVIIGQLMQRGLTATTFRRLVVFNMFWHFLDLVWIFIFTFVYLIGVV